MLAWLHPLWGQIWAYVSVNQDLSEDFEKETNRVAPLEYAHRNNVLEERIPISLLRAWGFRSPDTTQLKFYSAAWHPLPAGGYGGVFDSTNPEWLSLSVATSRTETQTASRVIVVTVTTVSVHTTSLIVSTPQPWHFAVLTGVVSGLIVAVIKSLARHAVRKKNRDEQGIKANVPREQGRHHGFR